MEQAVTLEATLAQACRRLDATSASARLDAELLLAEVLGLARAALHARGDERLSAPERARFDALLARRVAGEPIAYLLGRREFWSLALEVDSRVLVPRPETELLVERALALGGERAEIADLGTGSGAIALALAHDRPRWRVTATDCSASALAVARANAARLGLDHVEFLEGSWLEPLRGRRFDLIVSNPPYVAASDPALGGDALRFEPRIALTPGADALAALRVIVRDAPAHLARGGHLLLEHGASQRDEVAALLVARGFADVRCRADLAGHPRVTEGRWP